MGLAAVSSFAMVVGPPTGYSPYGWIVLGCSAASLIVFAIDWRDRPAAPRHVDVVANSASGNTMHPFCWTECGQPYKPRWPELVVQSKEGLAASTRDA
ncbi:MAG: hypothetical protein JW955_15440 [Sedimentisphaerales bacterium]|nr:hypothetical protein [Sedimentisphaerales bacterium]